MTDEIRAMLDEMMGPDRNGDGTSRERRFTDDNVCKPYLLGLCPHDLFTNTKADIGACAKLHSEPLKAQYEKRIQQSPRDYGFEVEAESVIERLVTSCDRKIEGAKRRLQSEQDPRDQMLENINLQIKRAMEEVERLGEEGQVEESMAMLKRVDELKEERVRIQAGGPTAQGSSGPQVQKLQVCEVCGALLSLMETDQRLADHFGGKQHLGYLKLREALTAMREKRGSRREREPQASSRDYRGGSGRDYERGRDYDRGRDRDRDRYQPRDYDRSRDYDRRDRDRDYDRYRDSDRDRDRRR